MDGLGLWFAGLFVGCGIAFGGFAIGAGIESGLKALAKAWGSATTEQRDDAS